MGQLDRHEPLIFFSDENNPDRHGIREPNSGSDFVPDQDVC